MMVETVATWTRYARKPIAAWACIASLLLFAAGPVCADSHASEEAAAQDVEAQIAETEQAASSAMDRLRAAEERLREVESKRAETLRKIEEAQSRLQEAQQEAEMARDRLKTANTVLQNIEQERSHAAHQLIDASVSTTAQPGDADGKTYTITGIVIEYAQDHPAHIAPEELMEQKVEMLRTLSGFVAPRAGDVNSHVSILDIPDLSEHRFYGSAVRKICVTLVAYFNSQNLIGVFVSPDPGQIDLRTGEDFRGEGDTTLKLVVRTAIISEIRTVARGDRFDPSVRINNPQHSRILGNAPLQPSTPGDFGSGALLNKQHLNRYINWLNRHPGRRVDMAVSSAGEDTPGGVALDLMVAENKPWLAYFQVSNTGTESTDKWRERFGFVHNQLTGNDDILSIDYTTAAFDEVHTIVASYERPWGDNDRVRWRVFGYYSEFTASDVGLSLENFEGEEWSFGGEIICNIYQEGNMFVDVVTGISYRDIENHNTLINERNQTAFLLPYVAVQLEKIERTSSLFASAQIKTNLGDLANTDADGVDPLGSTGQVGAHKNYWIMSWNSSFSFFLEPVLNPEGWADSSTPASSTLAHEVYMAFRGQYTFQERVISQEQLVIGGLYSVRGYDQSEAAGHSGFVTTFEYRYHVPRAFAISDQPGELFGKPFKWAPQQVYGLPDWDLMLRAFLDVGYAMVHESFVFEEDEALVGMGVGAELAIKRNVTIRVDWGFALAKTEQTETGDSEVHFVATLLY